LQTLEHDEVMWVLPGQLSTMDLAPADVGIVEAMQETD
jgi:hypothetical protein